MESTPRLDAQCNDHPMENADDCSKKQRLEFARSKA
jgi:hypothetical protein